MRMTTTVLLAMLLAGSVQAESLFRITVGIGSETIADYTKIMEVTPDTLTARYLYEHSDGDLLVVRTDLQRENGEFTSSIHSVESLSTPGSSLLIDCAGATCVATVASGSVTFDGHDEVLPPSVRTTGQALYAALPSGFQDEITRLVELGTTWDPEFWVLARALERLFFLDPAPVTLSSVSEELTAIKDFDPLVVPPTPFEEQFAEAYFE